MTTKRHCLSRRAGDTQAASSEIIFQTVFENAYFGMVLVGIDGHFLRANQAACELFGYSQDELRKLTFKDITYPDDLDAGIDLFKDLISGKYTGAKLEKRYIRKDGNLIWTRLSTSLVQETSGAPQYLVTLFQDISDRKQVESDLVEKESQYRGIFENAFVGILVNDFNGRITEVNPAFCSMHGYTRAELLGQTLELFIRESDQSIFNEYLDTVKQGKTFKCKAEDIRKNGTSFPVEVHGSPISFHGKPHALAIVQDITTRVQNEEILENLVASRMQELSALVDVTNVASSSLDLSEVLERSLDSVLGAMRCDMGAIHLVNETRDEVTLSSWRNVPREILEEIEMMPVSESLPGRILEQNSPLIVPDMMQDPDTVPAARRILGQSVYLGAPIKTRGKILGALVVIGQAGRQFTPNETSLLSSIAQQIGIAVENARLHQQAEILAITEERQRLAREIHDTLAQGFTGIKIQLEAVESALELGNEELALQRLARSRLLADQSLAEARRSIWALRSPSLAKKSFIDALRDSVRVLTAGTELNVSVQVQESLPCFPMELQTDLLRVAQEAVMNVVKHAQAKSIVLQFEYRERKIRMEIVDDGKGYLPARDDGEGDRTGFGSIAMEERMARHGGSLQIQSTPQSGTRIIAELTFDEEETHGYGNDPGSDRR